MIRVLFRPLLQAAILATLPGVAGAYDLKPIDEAQATEYKLEPTFYKKGVLVQGILIATSKKVSDYTLLEAAYQFDMVMKTIRPEVAAGFVLGKYSASSSPRTNSPRTCRSLRATKRVVSWISTIGGNAAS
jgi:hypothetical protein